MKKLLFTSTFAACAVAAFAQDIPMGYQYEVNAIYERVTERGPYLTNRFFDNMFVGVGGGVNLYFGDYDGDGSFKDRLAPAIDVNLGKWITPSVGLRAQFTGIKAKGFSRMEGPYTSGSLDKDNLYPKKFNFFSVHGDVLWNVSNAIGGFRSDRFWEFVPFAGFGYTKSEAHGKCFDDFAMSAGLLNKLRIINQLHVTIEARGMMVKSGFDKFHEKDRNWDCLASLTAGLQVTFGPSGGFKRPVYVAPADYTPYIQRIANLERDLGAVVMRADQLQKELNAERNKPRATVEKAVPASLQVFFKINSAVVTDQGMLNLERIAKSIKATPDMKYTVVGYADSATGTPKINTPLSQKRAEAVVKILTEKFGVKASQLMMEYKGGVDMYKKPELDRTVIIGQ